MQVVDENDEEAAGQIVGGARRRQEDAVLQPQARRELLADTAALHAHQRGDVPHFALVHDHEVAGRQIVRKRPFPSRGTTIIVTS